MTTHWRDLLGNISASDVIRLYHGTRRDESQTLAAWLERQSLELWAANGEHRAQDWHTLAEQLLSDLARQFGTVEHAGREYTLTTIADFSNRVFVGWWGDASEGEPYTVEFCADAIDTAGDAYTVYWQFDAVKGEEPALDGWGWSDNNIVRVVAA